MILDTIAASVRKRVKERKREVPEAELRRRAYKSLEGRMGREGGSERIPASCSETEEKEEAEGFPFQAALKKPGISFICEVKRASPSKGLIAPEFPYVDIAKEYERAGADAVSVLTEPEFFLGNDRYLEEIHREVSLPLLRKDFTIDAYQIYEAKLLGASAVLLIVSLLTKEELKKFLNICRELKLSALTEAHSEEEVAVAAEAGAGIIGINNRNLKTFEVDFSNALRLRRLVDKDTIFVAESGIHSGEDMRALAEARVDAVLVGEALMRAADRKKALSALKATAEGLSQ